MPERKADISLMNIKTRSIMVMTTISMQAFLSSLSFLFTIITIRKFAYKKVPLRRKGINVPTLNYIMRSECGRGGLRDVLEVYDRHYKDETEVACVDASLSFDNVTYGIGMSMLNGNSFSKIDYDARGYKERQKISIIYAEIRAIRHAYPAGKRCEGDFIIMSDSWEAVRIVRDGRTADPKMAELHREFYYLRKKFPNIELHHIDKNIRKHMLLKSGDIPPAKYESIVNVLGTADSVAKHMKNDVMERRSGNRVKGYFLGKRGKDGIYRYEEDELTWSLKPLPDGSCS